MKIKLLLFSLLYATTLSTFAQINNERGTVELNNNQTLTGVITNYVDEPSQVILVDETGEKQVLKSTDVAIIRLYNGKQFVSAYVETSKGKKQLVIQSLILTKDGINLYKRQNQRDEFFVSRNNKFYSLENNEIEVTENSKTFKRYDHQYISVLTQLMKDRMDLVARLNALELKEAALIKLLTEYAGGQVDYFNSGARNFDKKEPYLSTYLQYSGIGSYTNKETDKYSSGFGVGAQYHFSKTGRGSLKFYLNGTQFYIDNLKYEMLGFTAFYQYDFLQTEKFNTYLSLPVLNLYYYKEMQAETSMESGITGGISINPNIGFEYKSNEKFGLYVEINQLLSVGALPKNFSVGLKYNFL